MADHDGYCQTCKWCVSWTQQEQRPRAGATPTLAGQFAQTDYELVNIAHTSAGATRRRCSGRRPCSRLASGARPSRACRPPSGAASTRRAKGRERGNAPAKEW